MNKLDHALLQKPPEYQKRQHKVIFLHDNAPYNAKSVKELLEALSWEILLHAPYKGEFYY